jgi:hypothetical protein
MTYRSSSKMVAIDKFLEELCPLRDFTIFRTFFHSAYRYSFDIWYIALPYQDTDQIWVGSDPLIFSRRYGPWTLKKITNYQFSALFFLSYSSRIISFTHFFSFCLQILIWYLVHCFAIPRYILSLRLIVHEVMALGLRKILRIISFPHFFLSAYRYLFDIWYISYPYQDTY